MDVKLSPFIIFFVCVTLGLQYASAKIPGMTLKANDGDKTCTTKYTTCSLTIEGKPVLVRGEKGDVGRPGFNGRPGIDGAKGDQGLSGLPGAKGAKGDAGENGIIGPQGPSGVKGEKGESGTNGLPGIPGKKGEPGEDGKVGPTGSTGMPGPVGPSGSSGSHGVCDCLNTPNIIYQVDTSYEEFGTLETPAEIPCKSANSSIVKSGSYHLGPTGNPFEVFCNMTSLETCIRIKKTTPECNHNPSKGAFWLNEMSIDMKELYNISSEHLIWLRDRSDSVRQTLKYNCLDSVPYSKHNMSSSVKLWAWNDLLIGPYPTNQSPIFYSVPEATDECKEGSTEWKSTIIELQSSNVYRLPIVDLWIGDIRNTDQKMSIESAELCFG